MKKIAFMLAAATMVLAACNRNAKKSAEDNIATDTTVVTVDSLSAHEQLPGVNALEDHVEVAAPIEVPQADLQAVPSDAKTRRAVRSMRRAESERDEMDAEMAEEAREMQEDDHNGRSEYQRD